MPRNFSPEDRQKASEFRYMRRWLSMPWLLGEGADQRAERRRAGVPDSAVANLPYQWSIPKSIALYLLDGNDKAARLEASSPQTPLKTYSGLGEVWKESSSLPRWPAVTPKA